VATELVGNAVRHGGGTGIEVILTRLRQQLYLAVRDFSHRRPRRVGPSGEAEPGGRGLLVVEALTSHWGYTLTHDGKVVWATMPSRPRSAAAGLGAAAAPGGHHQRLAGVEAGP
jgi:anti-sigma regulatory factor (Ser/Thr protein kinase)